MNELEKLRLRCAALEQALAPFALRGMVFTSIRMDMTAKGDDVDMCGGTWTMDNKGEVDLAYDCYAYLAAFRIYGEERTRLLMRANIEQQIMESDALTEREGQTIN